MRLRIENREVDAAEWLAVQHLQADRHEIPIEETVLKEPADDERCHSSEDRERRRVDYQADRGHDEKEQTNCYGDPTPTTSSTPQR